MGLLLKHVGKFWEVQKSLLTGAGRTGRFRSLCSWEREDTVLQVVLAMARNLYIGTKSKIEPKGGGKVPENAIKNVSNRVDFGSTIGTRQESQCLPYAGFFSLLPSDFCQIFAMSTT